MSRFDERTLLLTGLLLANLGLGWVVYSLATGAPVASETPDVPPPSIAVDMPEAGDFPRTAPEQLNELMQRPLFWKGRRPYVPPETKAKPQPERPSVQPPEGLRLVGVVGAGGSRLALVANAEGDVARVGEGASAHGWKVLRIRGRSITLEKGGSEFRVDMPEPGETGSVSDWEAPEKGDVEGSSGGSGIVEITRQRLKEARSNAQKKP